MRGFFESIRWRECHTNKKKLVNIAFYYIFVCVCVSHSSYWWFFECERAAIVSWLIFTFHISSCVLFYDVWYLRHMEKRHVYCDSDFVVLRVFLVSNHTNQRDKHTHTNAIQWNIERTCKWIRSPDSEKKKKEEENENMILKLSPF